MNATGPDPIRAFITLETTFQKATESRSRIDSGFLLQFDGNTYLVTAEHVMEEHDRLIEAGYEAVAAKVVTFSWFDRSIDGSKGLRGDEIPIHYKQLAYHSPGYFKRLIRDPEFYGGTPGKEALNSLCADPHVKEFLTVSGYEHWDFVLIPVSELTHMNLKALNVRPLEILPMDDSSIEISEIRLLGVPERTIALPGEVNPVHPEYCIESTLLALEPPESSYFYAKRPSRTLLPLRFEIREGTAKSNSFVGCSGGPVVAYTNRGVYLLGVQVTQIPRGTFYELEVQDPRIFLEIVRGALQEGIEHHAD